MAGRAYVPVGENKDEKRSLRLASLWKNLNMTVLKEKLNPE